MRTLAIWKERVKKELKLRIDKIKRKKFFSNADMQEEFLQKNIDMIQSNMDRIKKMDTKVRVYSHLDRYKFIN